MHKLEKQVFLFFKDFKYSNFAFDFYNKLLNNYNVINEKPQEQQKNHKKYLAYFHPSIL